MNEDFFNDICYPHFDEKSGSDMILKDRVSDIYQNYSLCEKDCEYDLFSDDLTYVNCSCTPKQEISKEENEGNFQVFLKPFLYSNFGVIKCYKLVFSIAGKLENIGFWVFGILILFHLPIYFYYCSNTVNPIRKFINGEMVKYDYIQVRENKNEDVKENENEDVKENAKENKNEDVKETAKENKNISKMIASSKEEILREKHIIKKRRKSSKRNIFDFKHNNYPPKRKYRKLSRNNQKTIETTSENRINNENDKIYSNEKKVKPNANQNSPYFYINEIINLYENKDSKYYKYFIKPNKNNFALNERKEEEPKTEHKKIKINFPLILINANNNGDYSPVESDYELDNYDYDEAIIYDKRQYFRVFFIYLISKDQLLNLIFVNPPLELKPLRIAIFIYNYIIDLSLNALFYLSDSISDSYHYKGAYKLLFTLINNWIISLSSTLVSFILLFFLESLTNSSDKLKDLFTKQEELLKNNKEYKVSEETKLEIQKNIDRILKCLKIKITAFFIIEFLFNLFFYYYIIAFCHVYKNTQISWLLDCVSSYILSFLITIALSFIYSLLYKLSLKFKNKILYKLMIMCKD